MNEGKDKSEENFLEDDVFEILKESLKHKLKKERAGNKQDIKNALKATLQEFLTCCKLFGYDFDGNIIEINFTNNKLEDNAMQNLFIQKIGEFMSKRINIQDDF